MAIVIDDDDGGRGDYDEDDDDGHDDDDDGDHDDGDDGDDNLNPLVKLFIGPDSDNHRGAKICIIYVLHSPLSSMLKDIKISCTVPYHHAES